MYLSDLAEIGVKLILVQQCDQYIPIYIFLRFAMRSLQLEKPGWSPLSDKAGGSVVHTGI